MAADNAARRPRENSSEGTLATRRSRARNSQAPTSLPTPRCAGPPGSRCARRREQPAPTPSPARRLKPQKRVHGSGPNARVAVARGDCAARSSLGSSGPRRPAPLLAPHASLLDESRAPATVGGCDWGAGYTNVTQWERIGGRTCVPRSVQRWVAGSGKALSPVRSRSEVGPGVGPGFVRTEYRGRSWLVRSGSPADPVLVTAGPGGGCAQWAGAPPTGCELGERSAPRAAILDTCWPRRLLTKALTPPLSPWSD